MLFIFEEKKDYNDLKKLEDTKSIIVGDLEAFELSEEIKDKYYKINEILDEKDIDNIINQLDLRKKNKITIARVPRYLIIMLDKDGNEIAEYKFNDIFDDCLLK